MTQSWQPKIFTQIDLQLVAPLKQDSQDDANITLQNDIFSQFWRNIGGPHVVHASCRPIEKNNPISPLLKVGPFKMSVF